MSDSELGELKFLIKKKKANLITYEETLRLINILHLMKKSKDIPPGVQVAAGILLATVVGKQKPKELAA